MAAPRLARIIAEAPPGELPDFIPPQLATLVSRAPAGDQWAHEIKLDGYRTAGRIARGKATMLTRKGLDWSAKFGPIADALASLKARAAYVDGEIIALDPSGVSSFGGLQEALSAGLVDRLLYYAFDLLHLDGRDLRGLPLVTRKEALQALLSGSGADGRVRYSEHHAGQGGAFFKQACRHGLEGMVSKRLDAPYQSGRGGAWLKVKCVRRQEMVIGGWRQSTAPGRELGSLLVGYYERGKLRYAGKVGTGFTERAARELLAELRKIERKDSPFVEVPREYRRDAHWVEPRLVAEVELTAWTRDGRIRHSSFKGLREDKDPREVRRELPADRQP